MTKKTRLIIVGGFLGAGKTTLLYEMTKKLMQEGKTVGLITNDQASELVDTSVLIRTEAAVTEVSGSCFCCNFNGFIDSIKSLETSSNVDYIIAEPVGSCTDLSATIMQPLKELFASELQISPLTVLADPIRLADILDGRTAGLHQSAAYIFQKQLEESDLLVISKSDLLEPNELVFLTEKVKAHYPYAHVLSLSSKEQVGIDEWIKMVNESTQVGRRIIEVDYDIYAEGEAVLGWLNGALLLKGNHVDWDVFAATFLTELGRKIDVLNVGVGHIKLILESGVHYLIGNLTGNLKTLQIRGTTGTSNEAQMVINARVGMPPEELNQLVRATLDQVAQSKVSAQISAWKCLSPGYPAPTHRYMQVV